MVKRMLMDATHPEETRVVVLDGTRLEEFDVETSTKKQIKGNIYLAKVVRVEPSLQAAFVDYGGNRHGFLAFAEIHPDYYQIPVADRERLIAEVERQHEEEERRRERQQESRARRNQGGGQNQSHDDHANHDHAHDGEASSEGGAAEAQSTQDHAHDHEHHDHDYHDHDHHDHEHHDDAHHDEGGHGEIPLAFIPPAITSEISSEDDHDDEDASAEAAPRENDNVESVDTRAEAPPETVGGEAQPGDEGSERSASANGADSSSNGRDLVPVQQKTNVETVGGEDDVDEDASGDDNQRRRFVAARHYKIQEVIKRRQIMLVQVVKEERGTKGAALTTYLSLAGRYCVLMPNSARGGGVSRKITSAQDRRRLKTILGDLELPKNMAVILRTAGAERNKAEIKRDYEYLQRTWNSIREVTMTSRAPALIHEEASLIKRAIRDIYSRDIEEVWVDGEEGYKTAKDFMKTLTPSHAKKVQRYKDDIIPLFHRYQVETQMESINSPVVQLRSGGSIVFGQTEALVAIDVNSGRATKERHIEETAYKTNMEAAEEIARQLRLRDLAGLVVIDFIDMEDNRNNNAVERKLKESLKADRARIQVGRISHFGLLELSRQRLRPSLIEANFRVCAHCAGTGMVRSTESAAVNSLRALEEEGVRRRSSEVTITLHTDVALYLLNYKREALANIETRYGMKIFVLGDALLVPPNFRLDRVKAVRAIGEDGVELPIVREALPAPMPEPEEEEVAEEEDESEAEAERPRDNNNNNRHREARPHHEGQEGGDQEGGGRKRRRRRRRRGGEPRDGEPQGGQNHGGQNQNGHQGGRHDHQNEGRSEPHEAPVHAEGQPGEAPAQNGEPRPEGGDGSERPRVDGEVRRSRRGRRGGRRRRRDGEPGGPRPEGEGEFAQPHVLAVEGSPSDAGVDRQIDLPTEVVESIRVAPQGEAGSSEGSENAPRGFFRALKDSVPWRRNEAPAEHAQPELAPPPPPPAPVVAAPEEPPQPPRKGWWTKPE